MLQNRTADAQQTFERVMQLDPKAGVAANNLAWIYLENGGSLDLALHLAEVAKAAMPNAAEVNDTLGWAYYREGQDPPGHHRVTAWPGAGSAQRHDRLSSGARA